jgi:hypothetical protein
MEHHQERSQFQRRHVESSLFDSICLRCYLTIAYAQHPGELEQVEDAHKCSPIRLFAIANGALPKNLRLD